MAAIKTEFLNSEFIGSSFQQTPPKNYAVFQPARFSTRKRRFSTQNG